MGCVVNGPGESKHADIGISLPGTAEEPRAPVYIDGALNVTLKGDTIVADFLRILDDYVEKRFGGSSANRRAQRHVAIGVHQTDVPPQESRLASRLPKKTSRSAGAGS